MRLDRPRIPPPPITFDAPFYIVGEGSADAAFVDALLKSRGVSNSNFVVGEAEGHTGFERHLNAVQASSDWPKLTHLAVVADNDLDPAQRFTNVQNALQRTGFPVPTTPSTIVTGPPVVGVFMMPGPGVQGNLETLLAEAVLAANPQFQPCLDNFGSCMVAPVSWDINKISKMRIHLLIAGCCDGDPSCSVAYIWNKSGNPIPLNSSRFDPLYSFLQQITAT